MWCYFHGSLSLFILGVFRGISINSVRNLERERKKKLWKIIQNFCRSIFKWKIHHFGRNVAFDRTQLKLTLEWFSIKNYLPVLFFSITNFFLRKQQQKLFFWGKATAVAAKNSIKFHMLCLSLTHSLHTQMCNIQLCFSSSCACTFDVFPHGKLFSSLVSAYYTWNNYYNDDEIFLFRNAHTFVCIVWLKWIYWKRTWIYCKNFN